MIFLRTQYWRRRMTKQEYEIQSREILQNGKYSDFVALDQKYIDSLEQEIELFEKMLNFACNELTQNGIYFDENMICSIEQWKEHIKKEVQNENT